MKRPIRPFVVLGLLALIAWTLFATELWAGNDPAPIAAVASAPESFFQAAKLRSLVEFLTSPELAGREFGTPGSQKAGDYIAEHLERAGIEPVVLKKLPETTVWSFFQPFVDRRRHCRNIIGILRGNDPALADEFVLLSAHYDHVGAIEETSHDRAPHNKRAEGLPERSDESPDTANVEFEASVQIFRGGQYYPGANDNASGVAGLLEVAAALGREPRSLRRSVLFAFWDAEEQGLDGSRFFGNNLDALLAGLLGQEPSSEEKPTMAEDSSSGKIVFSLNLDMIGTLADNQLEVIGYRSGTGMRQLLSRCNTTAGLKLVFDHKMWTNSDHYSLYRKRIPSILLTTGMIGPYHTPEDTADRLDYEGMERILDFVYRSAEDLACCDSRALPQYRLNEWNLGKLNAADESEAEKAKVLEQSESALGHAGGPDLIDFETETITELKGEPGSGTGIQFREDEAEPDVLIISDAGGDAEAVRRGLLPGVRIYSIDARKPTRKKWEAIRPDSPVELEIESDGTVRKIAF